MALTTHASDDGKQITIAISGRFDFNLYRDFRNAYERNLGKVARYIIDLNKTEYLDSSALGMFLVLRDHAGGDQADIHIINCNPEIRNILSISNFHKLFRIA